jgi:deoxyribonuclease (pyrimidine dimer)
MTRINAGIPPIELTNKHLLAEHREIKRIPNIVKSGKAHINNIPENFTLGTGHVKFFYTRLGYLYQRYCDLYQECKNRGFNVTWYGGAWEGIPGELLNDWQPTQKDINIIKERIKSKIS